MKTSLLILSIMLFSLISGALGAFGYLHYMSPQVVSQNSSQDTSIQRSPINGKSELQSIESAITTTVQDIAPSVVSIVIKKDLVIYRSDPWGFFQQPAGTVTRQVGGGSGFFVKTDGTLITNKHVVSDSNAEYTVILSDGAELDAKVLALDPINDLAVMQVIRSTNQSFTPLKLIENTDEIQVGEFALAVGNALAEFQNSVSLGIISGKERKIEAQGQSLSGLIQTDAAINPGNSGGPLLNLDGQVMGVNTAIVNGSNGIGFSIALTQERVDYMLKSIAQDGRIKRPFIGINYIQNSPGIASELGLQADYGAYIIDETESIVTGSSAEDTGLQPGDIILEVMGQKIDGETPLGSIIQNTIPGDLLSLKVLKKNGTEEILELTLGEY